MIAKTFVSFLGIKPFVIMEIRTLVRNHIDVVSPGLRRAGAVGRMRQLRSHRLRSICHPAVIATALYWTNVASVTLDLAMPARPCARRPASPD